MCLLTLKDAIFDFWQPSCILKELLILVFVVLKIIQDGVLAQMLFLHQLDCSMSDFKILCLFHRRWKSSS
jgi:hypothetical protein